MRRVLALAALLTASTATFHPASAQPDAAEPEWVEQAKIVAQMQGISVGEAVRRARLINKLNDSIKRFENDPDYAGAWIENDARNFRAKIAFRGGKKPSIDDTELREVTTIEMAPRSMGDLAQARASLAQTLRQHDIRGSITVDPRTQRMSLFPDDPAKLKALIAAGTVTIPDFIDVQN